MNEVTEQNFATFYPQLEKAINNATFIAIDCEFTGISSDENVKPSLFDPLAERYKVLKRNIEEYVIIQFGIAVFKHVPPDNAFKTECYNFYLFPRSIPYMNRKLSWQVEALEFLCRYNFDFKKWVNNGICYVDEADEKLLKECIKHGDLAGDLQCLSLDEEEDLKESRNKVAEWLTKDKDNVMFQLPAVSPILQYMMHKELRSSFKNIWTTSGYKTVDVIQVTTSMRELLEKEDKKQLEDMLLNSYVGFSKVFKLLTSCRKPIVGHNVLLDLMFTHQQFYKKLPDSYKQFKNNIHTLFPQIFDTKYMSSELRKMYSKDEVNWKVNSLSTLYEFFTKKGGHLAFNAPTIQLNNEFSSTDKGSYHHAGWDAYFAGSIFIKMGHIFCVKKFGTGIEDRTMTQSELMSSIKNFANYINIARSSEVSMKLDGEDPTLSRPEWLHVHLKSSNIDTKQLIEKFSSFGQVDIMPFARRRVLVAVANHNSALYILQHFKTCKEFQVARYNRIRHAAPSTICLWSGVILTGGMFAWTLKQIFLKATP